MQTLPALSAAVAALVLAVVLAPATLPLALIVSGLLLGTVWMGAVWIALDRRGRRDDDRRVPVRVPAVRERDRRRG